MGLAPEPSSISATQPTYALLFIVCLVSPIVENGLMIMLFVILERSMPSVVAGTIAAALLALLHAFDGWNTALVVWPALAVFVFTYDAYRARPALAFSASCGVHAIDNAVIALFILSGRSTASVA